MVEERTGRVVERCGGRGVWGLAGFGLAGVLLAFVLSAVAVSSAHATKFVHSVVAEGFGPAEGQFGSTGPHDIAVNRSSVADGSLDPLGESTDGYVYVADNGSHRIQVFDDDGEFRFMFGRGVLDGATAAQVCTADDVPCSTGVAGVLGGMFNQPHGVVIDQASGHVFVRDRGNRRVQEFEADGTFVRAWGWDVVASGPGDDTTAPINEFETCNAANGDVCRDGTAGTGPGQFAASFAVGGGIDLHVASGDVLVADPGNQRIQRFGVPANGTDPVTTVSEFGPITGFGSGPLGAVHIAVDGAGIVYAPNSAGVLARYDLNTSSFLAPLDVPAATGTDPGASTVGLEVDSMTGNLFMARFRSLADGQRYSPVLELGDPGAVDTGDVDLAGTHVDGTNYLWDGIGLEVDSGCMYLTSFSPANSVLYACEGPLPPPVIVFDPYSAVGPRSGTVNFSIDTTGELPVSYELQLSNPESLNSFVTVASGEVDGSPTPVDVSEAVTGLRAGTAYTVRVVTSKPFNNPSATTTNVAPLVTSGDAPSVIDVGADSITYSSARLTGRVDPNGEQTGYRFEWGTDGFDNAIPVPAGVVGDGFGFKQVSAQLSGLQPATTYQSRLVATSDEGTTVRPLPATTFTTLAQPQDNERAFELVTPPDKYGGQGVGFWPAGLGHLGSSGIAAHRDERFAAQAQFGSTLDGDGGFSHSNDWIFAERNPDGTGWRSRSPLTHANYAPTTGQPVEIRGATDDLSLVSWAAPATLAFFPEMVGGGNSALGRPGWQNFSAGVVGDWGGPFGPPTRWEVFGPTSVDQIVNTSQITDQGRGVFQLAFSNDGSTAVGQATGASTSLSQVHGLAGPNDPTWPAFGDLLSGRSIYVGDLSAGLADSFAGTSARALVNVCSGASGVDRTVIPSSDGTSFAGVDCPAGVDGRDRLVSSRGAALSAGRYIRGGAVSDDGQRVFFLSPDPLGSGVRNGTSTLCTGTGPATGDTASGEASCPPQLYVRQRVGDGFVTRWVSRPEPALFGQQAASLLGTARFEGASADGSRVYFRSNTPLTVDDPNGLGAPTPGGVKTGTPHASSWDLYMVQLADGPDPMGAGSSITRISAGPDGDGDCNSPVPSFGDPTRPGVDDGSVGALRFLSDDGTRAYFTCQAPLPGVSASVDEQRITTPGGTPTTTDQANIYLYDHNRPLAERWRFVARLPRATDSLATCATTGVERRSPFQASTGARPAIATNAAGSNCFNGTADGTFVTLFTEGRLTADDPGGTPVDDPPGNPVADIYAYDAAADRLSRVTAPQGGSEAGYPCLGDDLGSDNVDESLLYTCRGDGGMDNQNGVTRDGPAPAHLGLAAAPDSPGDRLAFFQSASRLVAGDRDDGYDVYQWRNGELSLVTSGAPGSEDALYKGNDASGRNVYFVTREALTWQDTDVVADIYTARIGGGIPEPEPIEICSALPGQCQGPDVGRMAVPPSRTQADGSGDVSSGRRAVLRVSRPGRRALRRVARRGVLRLGVRVSEAGVVRGVVRGRVAKGRKLRRVGAGRVRAVRAGRVVLRLRLSRSAVRRLRSGRRLRVAVRVSGLGARARVVRLSVPGRAGK